MTAELEYAYLGTEFILRVNEEIMNRAVRVKVAVKDKIKRIFDNNVATLSNVEPVAEEPVQVEMGIESLIDISEENLLALNDKLNAMQEQENVPHAIKRAVLFTGGLVSKIKGVTEKWFEGMPVVEKKVESHVEMPSVEITNHLGGEVVPGTWDDMPEKVVAPANVEVPAVNMDEVVPAVESQVNAQSEMEIPNFVPDFGELPANEAPVAESEENNELNSFEFVPEPLSVGEVANEEYVSEPNVVAEPEVKSEEEPVAEMTAEEEVPPVDSNVENEVEMPQVEAVEAEEPEVSVANEISEDEKEKGKMSIEDKIQELLNRKREVHHEEPEMEVTHVEETAVDEEADKKIVRETPEFTQAGVIARLQRINNTLKEKDAAIRNLTAKNEAAKEEVSQAKEKISGYEAVVEDLTVKNNSLTKENERLSMRVEEAETASQSTISKLEAQLAELTQARAEEKEASRKAFVELKEKHANEMADMRQKHAKELAAVSETKEKQIQAIYETISEALGEHVEEYDSGKGMAA